VGNFGDSLHFDNRFHHGDIDAKRLAAKIKYNKFFLHDD